MGTIFILKTLIIENNIQNQPASKLAGHQNHIVMKTTITNHKDTNAALNLMFDNFFQVSILADRPGIANPEDELYKIDGISIKLKHWATFLAIVNEESGYNLREWHYKEVLRDFLNKLNENAMLLTQILEAGFKMLMDRVAQQN